MSNGNVAAFEFMKCFWSFTHMYDDLVDRDKPVSSEVAGEHLIEMIRQFLFNDFFCQHKTLLFPLLVSTVNRWVDGDEWEASSDPHKRAAATFVRCGDVDLYHFIAYLTGGWDLMRQTKGARAYDQDKPKQE